MRSSKPARIADVVYFFDTSALAKLYHPELGTEAVTAIVQSTHRTLIVSQLVEVEMASVAAIKVRRGEMSVAQADAMLRQITVNVALGDLLVERIDDQIYASAAHLLTLHARQHSLRTLDALHLASAIRRGNLISLDFFVTADRALAVVAELEGLAVMNPEHPT